MTLAHMAECLRSMAPTIDAALAAGLRELAEDADWSDYELRASFDDLLRLSQGTDACYDRPSIGWMYAAWYQGRRMQEALRALAGPLSEANSPVQIVDVGCGTGATAWAVGLLSLAASETGNEWPTVFVHAIDASEPMLDAADDLWSSAEDRISTDQVHVAHHLMSWTDLGDLDLGRGTTWLTGGFLFDASDGSRAEAIGDLFGRLASSVGAEKIFLHGARSKTVTVQSAGAALEARGWSAEPQSPLKKVWSGPILAVAEHRRRALGQCGALNTWPQPPSFDGPAPAFRLWASAEVAPMLIPRGPRGFALDEAQEAASRPTSGPTAIVGAAGSGKSRVLIERLFRTLEQHPAREGPPTVLCTAFNKWMVNQLERWFAARCEAEGWSFVRRSDHSREADITYLNAGRWSVRFLNWDKIGAQIYGPPVGRVGHAAAGRPGRSGR